MDYLKINYLILNIYKEHKIKSFPIDCFDLLELYGFTCKSYSSQPNKKRAKCFLVSNDAFTIKNTVFYNDEMLNGRIRFTLMHELGHYILGHEEPLTIQHEKQADLFASHILAPRMAIHYAQCKNLNDVSKVFGMTFEASDYAFQDYRRWHRRVTYHKMSEIDKAMYQHFYDEEFKGFVYSQKECTLCGRKLINYNDESCFSHTNIYKFHDWEVDKLENQLLRAEKDWLYRGL